MKAQSSMRTIVQYERLSVSYAQIDHVEVRGRALDAVNGWCAAQASSRRKRYLVLASVQ